MIGELDTTSVRGALAIRLRDVIQHRWAAEVQAIGVRGSVAHGDDVDSSDVNLVVVTFRPRTGPKPASQSLRPAMTASSLATYQAVGVPGVAAFAARAEPGLGTVGSLAESGSTVRS